MKGKSLLILSLMYFASINVFAIQAENAKLISQKVWGASNIKLSFKTTQLDQNRLRMLMAQFKNEKVDQLIGAGMKINTVHAHPAGSNSSVEADNWLLIFNKTTTEQTYAIKHLACPVRFLEDGTMKHEPCSYTSEYVSVEPHKFYNSFGATVVNWIPAEPGKYGFSLQTSVQNLDNTVLYETADFASVIIAAADKK